MLETVRKFQACYYVVEPQGDRMDTETKIFVNNDLDVVMARMQARNIAREMGFSTVDQARISLATSELARVLSWAAQESSEMIISNVTRNGSLGLQVACLIQQKHISEGDAITQESAPQRSFAGACRLADESNIELYDNQHARVTLIKWLK